MTANFLKFTGGYRILIRDKFFRALSTKQVNVSENNVEEIRIPVPWGHIAGKWWGSKNQRPILSVHGWRDNANSFNALIPKLSKNLSFLAIDLPGHGLSSHLNKGFFYKTYDVASVFKRLQEHFKWDKLSLMGHSYGSSCSFLFSSCFPDEVDFYIAIDNIKPLSLEPERLIKNASTTIEKLLQYETELEDSEPCYTKDDLIKEFIKSRDNSLSPTSCEILIERGTRVENGLFKLRRDRRVQTSFLSGFTQQEILQLAKSLKCSVLLIRAKNGTWSEKQEYTLQVIDIIKTSTKRFDHHEFEGTHYLHLNNPELIAPVINSFIASVTGKN